MIKKECPGCAVEIDENDMICPICQYEFPQKKSKVVVVGLILISLALIYPIYSFIKKIIASL